ncbi:uncharacterized protein EI90DRAFT_3287418 [Cantharellus anzutake]|uniref:uncharacterized protein n=1 Tax=Cantharellus anzutake TaxID=1750568 RepID=UPI001903DE9F|nr:uncharacterized protein EI90DRAFT_3287418 [Cantharellus anzutake]KAF8336275.1 hypothetical protein EI90DRAFT_3287418 [Cantharellus anzutake]
MQSMDDPPRRRKQRQAPHVDDDETETPRSADDIRKTRKRKERLGRPSRHDVDNGNTQHKPEESSAWFDGPLALTLLPPIGSFLTGGDYVRDALILALLFYYLRALIKTPWELYTRSRARRPPSGYEEDLESEDEDEPDHIRQIRVLARSELRFAELTYLALCLLTPLIGTMLLCYASSIMSASGSISWFSTGLFILATGIRPWRHLISLLTNRTEALHDIVYAPKVNSRGRGRRTISEDEREKHRDQRTKEAVEAAITFSKEQTYNTRRDLQDSTGRISVLESHINELATSLETLSTRLTTPHSPTNIQQRAQQEAAIQAQLEAQVQNHDKTQAALSQVSSHLSTLQTSFSALQARVRTQEEVVEDAQTTIRNAARSSESLRSDIEVRLDETGRGLANLERRLEGEAERRAGEERSHTEQRDAVEARIEGIERSLGNIANLLEANEKKANDALVSANATAAKLSFGPPPGNVHGNLDGASTRPNIHPLVWTGGNGTTAQKRLSSSGNAFQLSSLRENEETFNWTNPLSPTTQAALQRTSTVPGGKLKTRSRSRSDAVLGNVPYGDYPLFSCRGLQARMVEYTFGAILLPVKISQRVLGFMLSVIGKGVRTGQNFKERKSWNAGSAGTGGIKKPKRTE